MAQVVHVKHRVAATVSTRKDGKLKMCVNASKVSAGSDKALLDLVVEDTEEIRIEAYHSSAKMTDGTSYLEAKRKLEV